MARAHDEVNKLSVRSRRRRRQLRDPIERAGDESNDEGWRVRWRAGRAGGLGQDWQTRGQERTALAGRAILSVLLMTGVVVAVVTTTSLAEGWTMLLDSGGGSGSPSRSINPKGRAGTIIAGWRFYWLAGGNSGYLGDLPRLTLYTARSQSRFHITCCILRRV
jgi:hypothetical protein